MRTKMKRPLALLLSILMTISVVSVGFIVPGSAADTGNSDSYSLTLKANGGTGDDVTTPAYNRQTVDLPENPFIKTGYHLTGWNTKADGSGVSYADKAKVTNPAVSYPARYIRVYAAGNTANEADGYLMCNHLSELEVIDTQGVNVALGKSGDVVTDGNESCANGAYYSYGDFYGKARYYQLDLGAHYDVQTVNMWRYWEGGTWIYHNTVVVLSENGTFAEGDRLVLFNADASNTYGFGFGTDMEYPESKYGISLNVSDVCSANAYTARYIRIYAAGNTQNDSEGYRMCNHLSELQVFDTNGQNVAYGKSGDVITDGVPSCAAGKYYNYGDYYGQSRYYQLDLGGKYDVQSIHMWRYWNGNFNYHNTVIVLSENGTFAEGDRFVVFNADTTGMFGFGCGTSGEYRETEKGRLFYVSEEAATRPTYDARYVRVYAAGNDRNDIDRAFMANQVVELQVMANGQNIALGKSGTVGTDGAIGDTNSYYGFGEFYGLPNYFQVDFGAVYPVDSVSYWGYYADGRAFNNVVVVLSENGTFAGSDCLVLWNSDRTNRFGFGTGLDPAFASTSAGKTFIVPENGDDLNTVTARYIRVYDYGNDANDATGYPRCNQVAELAAIMPNGVNIAAAATAQDASIIDGNITTGTYAPYGTGYGFPNEYFWVDLGQEYELAQIKLWRYWVDTRTFHSQVIALSRNGTFAGDDLTVIYNTDSNNVHGFGAGSDAAYVETSAGHTFTMPDMHTGPSAKARYVRVYSGGSYVNDAAGQAYCEHVTELQVFAGNNVNLAYGKTGTTATDGNTNDSSYFGYGGYYNTPHYVQVDLGDVYDVTAVKLWQYYSDARTYHNNVIVLSENGTFAGNDYTVIFNTDYCNMHGFGKGFDSEYVETAAGREFGIRNAYAPASGNKTLYAQWAPNTYTIAFNANCTAATGSTASVSATYDADATLTSNGFVRDHYTFTGWATTANGTVAYANGATVKNLATVNNDTITLYAVWEENPSAITFVNEDGSLLSSQVVDPGEMPVIPEIPAKASDVDCHYTAAGWDSEVVAAHADKTYKAVYTAAAHVGMDDFICDVCEFYDAAAHLADVKAKAIAAIEAAVGEDAPYGVSAIADYAIVRLHNATTIDAVTAEKEAALDVIDAIVNDKRAAYAEAQTALTEAQAALTEAQTALNEKAAALTETQNALTTANAALTAANAQIDTLTNELNATKTELETKKAALDDANAALTAAAAEKTALETQLAEKETALAALQDTVDADADEIAALEADIDELEAAISEKEDVITAKTNEITALEATVAANETAIAAAQTQIDGLTADLTDAQTQVDTLTAALTEAQTALAAKDAALTAANAELATANAALITANAQISSLTEDINEKTAALTTAENVIATANAALANAETQIDGLTDDLAAANDALAAKETALAAAQAEKTALETQLAGLKDDLDADKDEIASLEAAVTAKNNEITALEASVAAYETAIAEAENDIAAKETEIASLKTRLNKALDDIEALREGIYVEPEDDGTCKYCGKIHQNVFDKFFCMIIRFFDFLVSVFEFSSVA